MEEITLGIRIAKPVTTQEDLDRYMAVAEWCNQNHAQIADREGYFEVIEAEEPEEQPDAMTELEKENAELKARLARIEEKLALLLDGDLK